MTECPLDDELVEPRVDRVLTQYRESPKLLHVIRTYLRHAETAYQHICDLPEKFDIDTAVGDQLTIIGKRLGWPRCHCVCTVQPVFGFECDGVINEYPVSGFCDGDVTWTDCGVFGLGEVCIEDDELYRAFLKARRYQFTAQFDIDSLNAAVRTLFGDAAMVLDAGRGRVVIAPGRALTSAETALLQLYPRVLPVAPGVLVRFHFGVLDVFGFGTGWGGFCEPVFPDGTELVTELGENLVDENGEDLITGPLTQGADWMCEVDVRPYKCT